MKHLVLITLLCFTFCKPDNKTDTAKLIIYRQFLHTDKAIQGFYKELIVLDNVDSILVYGCPLFEQEIEIKIDSMRAEFYNISVVEIQQQLKNNKNKDIQNIENYRIESENGEKIPLSAVASFHLIQTTKKTEIYKPKPETYYHNNRPAIKLELFYHDYRKKKLAELIDRKLKIVYSQLPDSYGELEYEIIFN